MAENDALKNFQFPKNNGLFVTFEDGDEFKLRVLTTDPVVTTKEFNNGGEISLSTKFAFVVYNFTLQKAQILNAGATITRNIQKIHQDEDFGADIRKIDIKIAATGSKLTRKYEVQVLPKTELLTPAQIKECAAINLDEKLADGQRMSFYDPSKYEAKKAMGDTFGKDEVHEVNEDEPINLDDIPF